MLIISAGEITAARELDPGCRLPVLIWGQQIHSYDIIRVVSVL